MDDSVIRIMLATGALAAAIWAIVQFVKGKKMDGDAHATWGTYNSVAIALMGGGACWYYLFEGHSNEWFWIAPAVLLMLVGLCFLQVSFRKQR